MDNLLTGIHAKKQPESITRKREKYDRVEFKNALNGAFQEKLFIMNVQQYIQLLLILLILIILFLLYKKH